MKKIILLISLVCSIAVYAQTGTAIYSITGSSTINVNSTFIEPFYCEASVKEAPSYKKVGLTGMKASYGSFYLKSYKFKGYETEAGFANSIHICRKPIGSDMEFTVLTLKSSRGFTSLSEIIPNVTGDFLFKKLDDDTYVLVFKEWTYANDPPMVSVVLIYKNSVKLVYNKPMFINSIKTGSFEMELQANAVEYIDENTPADVAELHKIWWDGKILRYQ